MRPHLLLAVLLTSTVLSAQGFVGRGTVYHSISPFQAPGVTAAGLQGNPSITTNEVIAWDNDDGQGGARSLFNAQTLGVLFGDRNGDGLPFDWPNIDALALDPTANVPLNGQPSVYDFLFSFDGDVLNQTGAVVIRAGDVLRLTGLGTAVVVVPESAFQAALGFSGRLNVDAMTLRPDGSLHVSFSGLGGRGTNIINPLSGNPGSVNWNAADIFAIRQPYGVQPALFLWRQSDLQPVAANYGFTVNDIVGLDVQPGQPLFNNPYDPRRTYQGGGRALPIWVSDGQDNVFCMDRNRNPRSPGVDEVFALFGFGASSLAGYVTNTSNPRVNLDAIALGDHTLGDQTRLTLDASSLLPAGGSPITLTARGADGAGEVYQILLASRLERGMGTLLGGAFSRLFLAPSDPLFIFGLDPLVAPLLQTAPSDADGTASTVPLTLPIAPGAELHFQAVKLGGTFPFSGPITIEIQ